MPDNAEMLRALKDEMWCRIKLKAIAGVLQSGTLDMDKPELLSMIDQMRRIILAEEAEVRGIPKTLEALVRKNLDEESAAIFLQGYANLNAWS